jgi:hypothetical protein
MTLLFTNVAWLWRHGRSLFGALAMKSGGRMSQPVAQSRVRETDRDPEMQMFTGCRAAVVSDLGFWLLGWAFDR